MNVLLPFVLAAASLGLFFGYIDPTFMSIKDLRVEKSEYDRALLNSRELTAERDKLLEKYNQMSIDDLGKITTLLPDNIDNVRLIIDIDEIARKHGMRIREFKTDAALESTIIGEDISPYGTLNLTFTTTASYNAFLAFIKDLERSLRIIDITSIKFSVAEIGALYDYSVTIKTYWLK